MLVIPSHLALLLALLFEKFVEEQRSRRGSDATRMRMSRRTLRRISGRQRLGDSVIFETAEHLADFGLVMFQVGDDVCILRATSALTFPRMRYQGALRDLVRASRRFSEADWAAVQARLEAVDDAEEEEE